MSHTGDTKPRGRYANLLLGKYFAENCMKMKEIGPRRVPCVSGALLDPPLKKSRSVTARKQVFFIILLETRITLSLVMITLVSIASESQFFCSYSLSGEFYKKLNQPISYFCVDIFEAPIYSAKFTVQQNWAWLHSDKIIQIIHFLVLIRRI